MALHVRQSRGAQGTQAFALARTRASAHCDRVSTRHNSCAHSHRAPDETPPRARSAQCGLAGDGSALAGIAALTGLTTLVLSGNALTGIPAAIGKLKALKTFECEANGLTTLPDEMKKLKALEVLRLQRNKLASLASLSKLTNLVVLDASFNALATLDFDLSNKTRLGTLLLKGNELTELPEDAGDLEALQSLNVSDNKLTELPASMGGLEKKLKEIVCDGNEFADPKLRKLVGGKVKDILKYLQKAGSGKGKGKKKK